MTSSFCAPLIRGVARSAGGFFLLATLALHALADDASLERRALALERELRCLVCQNESIDDSNADLAADLRRRGILRAAEFSWERSADLTWNAVDEVVRKASA